MRDEAAQAEEVCDRILEAREQGMELRAQAVLARTSHDSDLLELELTRRRIPFHKYGGLRYLEAAHVKDFVATLRLVDNGADDVAWFRVLQLVEGVGPVSARRAIAAMATGGAVTAGEPGDGPLAAVPDRLAAWASRAPSHPRGGARQRGRADRRAASRRAPSRGPGRAPRALRDVLAPLIRLRYPDGALRVQDLDQLVAAAHQATRPAPLRRRARRSTRRARAPTSPSRRTWTRTT